jgi:hypothetical protein
MKTQQSKLIKVKGKINAKSIDALLALGFTVVFSK